MAKTKNFTYAGFWWRAAALAVDVGVIILPIAALLFLVGLFDENNQGDSFSMVDSFFAWIPMLVISLPTNPLVIIYFGCFESSSWQATPGKMLLRLKVVDHTGDKLLFWHAIGRNFCKILSAYLLCAGFIMAGLTRHKQALHDVMTECLVIKEN